MNKFIYLIDTDTLIEILRKRGRSAKGKLIANESFVAVSSISVFELEYGVELWHDPDNARRELSAVLRLVTTVPFDDAAAVRSGVVRAQLAAKGTPIGPYDTLLAGHALSQGLIMITNNSQHFERVPGLQVENWLN